MALQIITSIKLVRAKALTAFNISDLYASLTLSQNASWTEIDFTPGSAIFKEKPNDSDSGKLYEPSLTFTKRNDSIAQSKILRGFEPYSLVVMITYNTGEKKIIGSPSSPAKLSVSQSTENSSILTYSITCQSTYRTLFLKN